MSHMEESYVKENEAGWCMFIRTVVTESRGPTEDSTC